MRSNLHLTKVSSADYSYLDLRCAKAEEHCHMTFMFWSSLKMLTSLTMKSCEKFNQEYVTLLSSFLCSAPFLFSYENNLS